MTEFDTAHGPNTAPRSSGRQILITAPPVADLAAALRFWTQLCALLAPHRIRGRLYRPYVAWEYHWSRSGADISLWIPDQIQMPAVLAAIEACWPGVHTHTTPALSPLTGQPLTPPTHGDPIGPDLVPALVTGRRLILGRHDALPLRTDHKTDPLTPLFTTAQPWREDWRTCVQILARPATTTQQATALQAIGRLRTGKPLKALPRLVDPLIARNTSRTPGRAERLAAALDKTSHARLQVAIHLAVILPPDADQDTSPSNHPDSTTSAPDAHAQAAAMADAFAVYTSPHNLLTARPLPHPQTRIQQRRFDGTDVVSALELACLAHLPIDTTVPGITRAGARTVPAPPQVPAPGPEAKHIGDTDTPPLRPVALPVEGARHHVHVLGATGTGKTTLLTNWILNDITAGRGTVVIDCKGDQINDILDRYPLDAIDRLTLIDPSHPGPPPGINVLAGPDPHLTVDHLVGIFKQLYTDSWGPRTDDILRAACLTTALAHGTLADVPRLLAEPAYRTRLLQPITDPVLAGFWTWYQQLSTPGRAAATGPVHNKLRALLLRPFVRAVIAQPATTINLGRILDGGVLLVRIPKGELGSDTVHLLGAFVFSALWQYATHRSRQAEPLRRDATVYGDEIHNYLGLLPSIEENLLPESRSFHLSLVLAHQDLAQLPRTVRETLSTNARNKIFFTVSPEDARTYERHIGPILNAYDLAHLDAYQAIARLVVHGTLTPAFTIRTHPLPPPIPDRATTIRTTLHPPATRPSDAPPPPAHTSHSEEAEPGPTPMPPPDS